MQETFFRGLIPACAGKTICRRRRRSNGPAHPRVCGENGRCHAGLPVPNGSSPRVRGKHANKTSQKSRTGLIPACAGKTMVRARSSGLARAHPRVCGENPLTGLTRPRAAGSSPRVRGKRLSGKWAALVAGLIPACAGKTIFGSPLGKKAGAHPRVCGENRRITRWSTFATGSSPRVRGKPALVDYVQDARGLIPACAGKTSHLVTRRA